MHILKVSELIVFLPVCCLLINCIGKQYFLLKQMLLPGIRHVSGTEFFAFQQDCTLFTEPIKETVALLTTETPDFIPPTLWPPNSLDLNPVDYSVWSVLQERVKVDNVVTCGRLETAHRGWRGSSWSQHHRVGHCSVASASACLCSRCRWTFWALSAVTLSTLHVIIKYWLTPIGPMLYFCKIVAT